MIKAAIFDIGGVVLVGRKGGRYSAVVKEVIARTATDSNADVEKFTRAYMGSFDAATAGSISEAEFLGRVSGAAGVSRRAMKRAYRAAFMVPNRVNAPMLSIARRLKRSGYRVAALSNVDSLAASPVRRLGAYKPFNPVVLSYKVHMLKPHVGVYRLMLRKLRLKPQECIFIDDMPANVEAARKLGFHAILYVNVRETRAMLEELGVRV